MSIRSFFARFRPYQEEESAAAALQGGLPRERSEAPVKKRRAPVHDAPRTYDTTTRPRIEMPRVSDTILLLRLAAAFVLILLGLLLPLPRGVGFAVFAVSLILSGYDAAIFGVSSTLRERTLNDCLLMIVACIAAFAAGGFASAAGAMLLFRLGRFLLQKAVSRSRDGVLETLKHGVDNVSMRRDGKLVSIPADEARPGDIILVRPGERVPLDGVVLEGISALDVTAVTGESTPVDAGPGDRVFSGSLNVSDLLTLRVTASMTDSTASRLYGIVADAEHYHARPELLTERGVRFFVPIVAVLAVLAAVLIPLLTEQTFADWVRRGAMLLVAACPCMLLIGLPLTYFHGLCGSVREGILFKGADKLDGTADVTCVVFGKTGTLTSGDFTVSEVHPRGLSEDALLRLAACAEALSEHPLSRGVVAACPETPDERAVKRFHEQPGMGVLAELTNGSVVVAGTDLLMQKLGITPDSPARPGSVVHVAADGRYAGYILLDDPVKRDAINAVSELNRLGARRVVLLTGDKKESADSVAKKLNITEVYAECPSEEKAARLREIMDLLPESGGVAFAGDGEGDIPSLQTADIGILMGGLDTAGAADAADVVIMTNEPSKVAEAVDKARTVRRVVKQNLILALACKAVILILGLSGLAPIWLAALVDAAASLALVITAMRAGDGLRFSDVMALILPNAGKKGEN